MRQALSRFAGVVLLACAASSLLAAPAAAGDKERDWGYEPRYEDGWEVLFGGTGLDAWDFNRARKGWVVTDQGELFRAAKSGDIWSKRRYCDFVLDLEFKVDKGTNSGVFIRTHSRRDWLHTGIEVQVLDSAGKTEPGRHDTGAVYDVKAPTKNAMRPAGQWNRYVLTVDENIIAIELNGQKVNEMDLDLWTEAHKNADGSKNKFKYAYRDMIREGFFALQDHGKPVWYRNIKVKVLGKREPLFTGRERYEDVIERELRDREERVRRRALEKERARESERGRGKGRGAASARSQVSGVAPRSRAEAAAERLFKMARQAERMGQRGAATIFYRKVTKDHPDTAAAARAAERLKSLER